MTLLTRAPRAQRGFTLVEMVIVLALLGVLSAILIPRVGGLLDKGDAARLGTDVSNVDLAVADFRNDRHQGPDGTPEWGAGPGSARRWYPTATGLPGNVELDLADGPTDDHGNRRLMKYVDGPGVGAPADAADVQAALVWLGLLVNEPSTVSPADNQTTGGATPRDDEVGEYLTAFPESAHADNTALVSGSATDGSYWYVVLHNGTIAAVYDGGSAFYAGYGDVYP